MLVTFEGIDGSGKTTAWQALRQEPPAMLDTADEAGASDEPLDRDSEPESGAVFTREPTDSWYGDAVERSIADADADPMAELFLYTADHAAHLSRTVRPALRADRTVISDRFVDSRYAYQGATLAEQEPFGDSGDGWIDGGDAATRAMEFVRDVHEPWTRTPDLTVYFDIDPATAAERSGGTNKFEHRAYLDRVRANYERLIASASDRFVRVDAGQPRCTMVERVRTIVNDALADS